MTSYEKLISILKNEPAVSRVKIFGQRLGPWGKGDKNPPWGGGGGGCPTIGFFLLLRVCKTFESFPSECIDKTIQSMDKRMSCSQQLAV